MEFWNQQEALNILQNQMLTALADDVSIPPAEAPLAAREPLQTRKSFFGRKSSSRPEKKSNGQSVQLPPVDVQVMLDEVHLRTETEFGLFETLRGRAVIVTVVVR